MRYVAFIDIIGSSGHKLLIFETSKEIVSREEELKATVVLALWIGALISTGSGNYDDFSHFLYWIFY